LTATARARRLLIIHNPTAGRRHRRFVAVLDALRQLGCTVFLRPTAAPGDARRLAMQADPGQHDAVVVAGGDGTIREVADGMRGTAIPLAIIPVGTANVLAIEIGLRLDPSAIARTVALGEPRPISLGLANGQPFLLMAGVGLDAHVVRHVDLRLKRRLGTVAYMVEALRQLSTFAFPSYEVHADGESWSAAAVVVANARHYGGRFLRAPAADLQSPTLEVCMFGAAGPRAAVSYALAGAVGRLPRSRTYRMVTANQVRISGPRGEPVQGDGDIITELDVTIEAVPHAIELIYPLASDHAAAPIPSSSGLLRRG